MADAIMQSFVALSKAERQSALNKLVGELSFDEGQSAIDAVRRKNDIIPRLPFELLLQVFSHLHILDTWSLRSVNKQWCQVLSSQEFVQTALSRWNSHDPADNGRSRDSLAKDSIFDKILHMQNLRLGRACSRLVIEDTGAAFSKLRLPLSRERIVLKGDRIAYVVEKPGVNIVVVRNLTSGDVFTLSGEERGMIVSVAITTQLVAFITFRGYLHVYKLSDPLSSSSECPVVQLPSAQIQTMTAHENTVVILNKTSDNDSIDDVLLYDVSSGSLKVLSCNASFLTLEPSDSIAFNTTRALIDSHRETIDVFRLLYREHEGLTRTLKVAHFRISFAGDLISKIALDQKVSTTNPPSNGRFIMEPLASTGYQSQFRVQVAENSPGGNIRNAFHLFFDADKCHLFQKPPSTQPRKSVLNMDTGLSRLRKNKHQFPLSSHWKDISLSMRHADAEDEDPHFECYSLMNDAFLVSLQLDIEKRQRSRIMVFCFDPKIDMHDGIKAEDLPGRELAIEKEWLHDGL